MGAVAPTRGRFTMLVLLALFAWLGAGDARPHTSKHFSKKVDVRIEENGDETVVIIGNLEILLRVRDDLIEASVTRNISDKVLGQLAGTLYAGVVKERRDCAARMFIKESVLISGNIDCKRKHFVVEMVGKTPRTITRDLHYIHPNRSILLETHKSKA